MGSTHTNRCQPNRGSSASSCKILLPPKSSPTLMQADLGWSLLSARREQARLILMFKLCHSLVNVNSSKTLIPITRPTRFSHPYVSETCICQKIPSAFFLPTNNSPMEQPVRHRGMRTHRGCLQLCFNDRWLHSSFHSALVFLFFVSLLYFYILTYKHDLTSRGLP